MKKYRINLLNWYGGEFKDFWFRRNALKYAEKNKSSWLWIDLINNWTNKETRLKSTDTGDYYRTEQGEYIKKPKEK
jgi:hypothetical protein